MPTPTYKPLANITLGSSAASVTFSSISQAYRDLVLVVNSKSSISNDNALIRFNSDTGSNYTRVFMSGNGSVTNSSAGSATSLPFSGAYWDMSSTTPDNKIVHVMDYSATNKHKSVLGRADLASESTNAVAGRWANTAAITTIQIIASFASGSTFALYGIAA